MKFKPNFNRLINQLIAVAILIGAVAFCYFDLFQFQHVWFKPSHRGMSYNWKNSLKPIDSTVSKKLPYKEYVVLKQKIEELRNEKNGDYYVWGSNFKQVIGTGKSWMCDTCTINYLGIFRDEQERFYITLPSWRLKTSVLPAPSADTMVFHVENGQSYVRKVIIEQETKNSGGGKSYQLRLADVPVKFRYSKRLDCVMIQVSELTKKILTVVINCASLLLLIGLFYLIILFIKFTFDVSKGNSFTDKNISRLKIISFSLLGYPLVMFLLNLLMRLIFSSYFTDDLVFKPGGLHNWWVTASIGVVFLSLFQAFRQGKALKDEQDLTV